VGVSQKQFVLLSQIAAVLRFVLRFCVVLLILCFDLVKRPDGDAAASAGGGGPRSIRRLASAIAAYTTRSSSQ
jgi:hypothetical protein